MLLDSSFSTLSPRLNPRPVPWVSRAISAAAVAVFVIVLMQSFRRNDIASWSVGIVYILYDTALLAFTAWHIRPLRAALSSAVHPQQDSGSADRPTLTVIVAARNEAGVLGVTIDTLAAQDEPPDCIMLADDGSVDDSACVLAERYGLAAPAEGHLSDAALVLPSLRWLRLPHGGKARALNRAIRHVDTDLMLTVDADTLLAPGALRAMRDAFAREPALAAATGVLTPVCGTHASGRIFQWFQRYEYVRNFLSRYAWMKLNGLLLISGAFAAFRTKAVIAVGGFDPECMVEDYELIHRMHRWSADHDLGWTVRVVGRAQALTDAPASPLAFLRQRRRWFGGFLQTQHWNRDMVGNARYHYLGTAMLPVKTLDTLQPIYGIAAFLVLIGLVATGQYRLALPILAIMLAKVIVDLSFHLWSITVYHRWTGTEHRMRPGPAIAASVLEPFTFQLLRHTGAAWGWIAFLTGRERWVRQERTALDRDAS